LSKNVSIDNFSACLPFRRCELNEIAASKNSQSDSIVGQTVHLRLVIVIVTASLSSAAVAQSFNQFVAFGDSSIDSGWYRNPAFPPLSNIAAFNAAFPGAVAKGAGVPTSSPGLISSEVLAAYFGLSAAPANQPGGSNYATSGARVNQINGPGDGLFRGAVPVDTQIQNYLTSNGGRANSQALYLISAGGNDVGFADDKIAGAASQIVYVRSAAADLVSGVRTLAAAGARYIVVPNRAESFGNANIQALRSIYNDALWSGLAAAGVNFIPADLNAVRLAIKANPASFGFLFPDNSDPACSRPIGFGDGWSLLCSSNPTSVSRFAPGADQTHLFADDQHLATAGQKIVADYEYSLVVAPSMMSMLAEAPLKTRTALIGAMQNQIQLSRRERGPGGYNTWLSGDVSRLAIRNYPGFPDDPGTPVSLTAGFDYRWPDGWLTGLAVTAGGQRAHFGLGFGGFTQTELAASAYLANSIGPLWFDAIATAGWIGHDVARTVPIGTTMQGNTASVNGFSISLAGETGYNFYARSVAHGPVIGITLAQVRIGRFVESGGFTSLGFDAQTRNAAISALGYQAQWDAGLWRPFVKAVWDHDFAARERSVTAFLTTSIAPSFTLPAVVAGTDWAQLTAGTTVRLARNLTGLVAVTGALAQQNTTTYGAQVGVNASF
jgi:outer membrane lipase/esterase